MTALPIEVTTTVVRRLRVFDRFLESRGSIAGLVLTGTWCVVAVAAGWLAPSDPFASVAPALSPPSVSHPFGTDDLGRDLLSGVVHGTRTTLIVVVAVVSVSTVIGLAIGSVAGYRGGVLDDVLTRLAEIVQSIPRFFLAILVVALLGASLGNLIGVLALTSWPWLARIVRAEVLSLREREFVDAARVAGATDRRILVRHVLPALLPSVTVVAALMAARVILLEASLSFLGLGDPSVISWGYLVNNAQRFVRFAWWMSVFPGLAIVIVVLGLHLLSDGLVDALDPGRTGSA